jgi:hypothetical protein
MRPGSPAPAMGPGTPGGDNFLPYTEADVVDSKASGFGADQVKEQTTYQGGVVVRHQAEELDACLIIRQCRSRCH